MAKLSLGLMFLSSLLLQACNSGVGDIRALMEPLEPNHPAQLDLVPEHTAIVPGEPLVLGLSIKHRPGYHTYWKHAGVVGLPTGLKWKLPEGFKAGPIQWPRPQLSKMAAYSVWGYERDVLLMVEIQTPKTLKLGQRITLQVDAQWMTCARDCNPGFATFTLRLPVASTNQRNVAWTKDFVRSRIEQPRPASGWKFTWRQEGSKIRLVGEALAQANKEVHGAYVFCSSKHVDSNVPQVFKKTKTGFELIAAVWEFAPENEGVLRGVLHSDDGWLAGGRTRSMAFEAKRK